MSRNKITQSDLQMQFCECSAAPMQKYIRLYLLLVLRFSATLLNYSFASQACSVHVAKC